MHESLYTNTYVSDLGHIGEWVQPRPKIGKPNGIPPGTKSIPQVRTQTYSRNSLETLHIMRAMYEQPTPF